MIPLLLAACDADAPRHHRRGPDDEGTGEVPEEPVDPPDCAVATFFPADGGPPEDLTDAFGFGSTVLLDRPGTLGLCDVVWPAGLVVAADVTVYGAGADRTVLDGGGVRVVIQVEDGASLVLETLTVVGGHGVDGGGVTAAGAAPLTLRDVVLRDNHAIHQGGGLFVAGPRDVLLEEVRFEDNDADSAGGGAFLRGANSLTVTGGAFVGNRAVGDGAGLRIHSTPATLWGTTFESNRSDDRGGGLSVDTGAHVIGEDLALTGNSASERGGGAWVDDQATLTLEDCTLTANTSSEGGAVAVKDEAAVTIRASDVVGNAAARAGGGVFAEAGASVELVDVALDENVAVDGAGLFLSDAFATIDRGSASGNVAQGSGGAVATSGPTASATLSDVTVQDNTAASGGAFFVGTGLVTCVGSEIVANTADDGGAAAVFEGTLVAVGCDLGVGDRDNEPADLRLVLGQLDVGYDADASFTCDGRACQ